MPASGLPGRVTGLAVCLVFDYTLGFALSDATSVNEQASRTPRPETRSVRAGRPLPRPWWPSVNTSGWTTATNGSRLASTSLSADSTRRDDRLGALAAGNRSADDTGRPRASSVRSTSDTEASEPGRHCHRRPHRVRGL